MAIGMRVKRWLDPKLAYESWAKSGSVYKAGQWLKSQGIFNEQTGKAFTSQSIWNSANLFILNNQREAREIFTQVMKANGIIPTDLDWYNFLVPKILKLNSKRFTEFMSTNSYLQPFIDNYVKEHKK